MLTLIKNLAELGENQENLSSFLEYPGSKTTKEARFILLETDKNNNFTYKGLSVTEELDESKTSMYLYPPKSGRPPSGVYKTPTVVFNEYEKSYLKKIYYWFRDNSKKNDLFLQLFKALEANEEKIKADLTGLGKNIFLSVKINDKYIGSFQDFISLIISDEEVINDISNKYGIKNVQLTNEICSICFNKNDNVYGFAVPYSFYTVDSPGFAYNFEQKNSVKQFPICLDCAKKVRGSGRIFLETELSLRLCGADYFLMPELIHYSDKNKERYKNIIQKIKKGRENLFSLYNSKEDFKIISKTEKHILQELGNEENFLSLNLFFYKKDQSKFSILASIEEVLPSNLKRLFEAAKKVDKVFYNNNITIHTKKEEKAINFDFSILSKLFENQDVNINKRSKREFFEILNNLMTLKPLSYNYLLNKIVDKVYKYSPSYIQGDFYKLKEATYESFLLINLLLELNLINVKGYNSIMTKIETPNLDLICSEFPEFFNDPVKKAVLGLGILTEELANIQYQDRKSKSIYKKLRNFKVDLKFLTENIFPEIKDKFHAYKKDYPSITILFEEISRCLLASNNKSLTVGETSYIFVLGINMSFNFMRKYNEKIKENKETKELQVVD